EEQLQNFHLDLQYELALKILISKLSSYKENGLSSFREVLQAETKLIAERERCKFALLLCVLCDDTDFVCILGRRNKKAIPKNVYEEDTNFSLRIEGLMELLPSEIFQDKGMKQFIDTVCARIKSRHDKVKSKIDFDAHQDDDPM